MYSVRWIKYIISVVHIDNLTLNVVLYTYISTESCEHIELVRESKVENMCPAKSGLWGYNLITIKIACCTKQHIFATVLPFPFKFRTLVPTPFLSVKIDFCDLDLFRALDTTIVNPAG